jgi:hypothetical protein
MSDVERRLRAFWNGLDEAVRPVEVDEALRERVGEGPVKPLMGRAPRRSRWWPRWAMAAAGFAAVLAFGGVAWLLGAGGGTEPGDHVGSSSVVTTTAAATTTTEAAPVAVWEGIPSTIWARTPPPAAVCPQGAEAQAPGTVDQARPASDLSPAALATDPRLDLPRPDSDVWNNQAAAFDRHAGRVMLIDATGSTWAFDVCSNVWQELNPAVIPAGALGSSSIGGRGHLVYDVDSDRTIAIGEDEVGVYNAASNTWTIRSSLPEYLIGSAGAVYDPVSGLVIVQVLEQGVLAYDVDTDTWSRVGRVLVSHHMVYDPALGLWSPAEPEPDATPLLVGYMADTDQLVFLHGGETGTQLVDPRTGASTPLENPPFGYGAWGEAYYAVGTDTVYMFGENASMCRLDPEAGRWVCADWPGDPSIAHYQGFVARVGDSINGRIILIDGYCCGGFSSDLPEQHSYDVWAIDLETGEWTQLLAPVGE